MNKKQVLITLLVGLLGVVIGALSVKIITDNDKSSMNGVKLDKPAEKPEFGDGKSATLDKDLPVGTISPYTVAIEPQKYQDKEVSIRGFIINTAPDQYSAVSQQANQPIGVRLDFTGTNIDPKTYSNVTSNTQVSGSSPDQKNPVTIKGKFIQKKQGDSFIYILGVQSVNP